MNLTTFPGIASYTGASKLISLEKICDYHNGVDFSILSPRFIDIEKRQALNFKTLNLMDKKNYTIGNLHLFLNAYITDKTKLSYRKSITDYIKDGLWNLPRTPIKHTDLNQILDFDMQTVAESINGKYHKGLYDMVKMNLPFYTCVYYAGGNNPKSQKYVIDHAGVIGVDIDGSYTIEEKIKLVEKIKTLKPYAMTVSTGGMPRPLFKVELLPHNNDFEKIEANHLALWLKIKQEFDNIGIQIDISCSNPNRLFYIAYNPDIKSEIYSDYITYKVKKTDITSSVKVNKKANKPTTEAFDKSYTSYSLDEQQLYIKEYLEEIFNDCIFCKYQPFYIEGGMYHALRDFYYSLSTLFKNDYMEYILAKFLLLSKIDTRLPNEYVNRGIDYIRGNVLKEKDELRTTDAWRYVFIFGNKIKEVRRKLESDSERNNLVEKIKLELVPYQTENGSFFHSCFELFNAETPTEDIEKFYYFLTCKTTNLPQILTSGNLKQYLSSFCRLQKNKINDKYIINGEEYDCYDDHSDNTFHKELVDRLKIMKRTHGEGDKVKLEEFCRYNADNYFDSAAIEIVDPAKKYFESISCEGEDEIQKVQAIFNKCSVNKKAHFLVDWCVGMMKNALTPEYYDRILILYSPKGGDGKTWWILNDLMPKPLQRYITTDYTIGLETTDNNFLVTENLICLEDEDKGSDRKTDEATKAASSKQRVSGRKAYARVRTERPRRANLMKTTNKNEIASAYENNRRNLVIELITRNWKEKDSFVNLWRETINVDKFWGQIHNLYTSGSYEIVQDSEICVENEKYVIKTEEEMLIDRYISKPTNQKYLRKTHIEIRQIIETISGKKGLKSLNGILKRKGFEWNTKGYKIIVLNGEEDAEKYNEQMLNQTDIFGSL